MSWFGEITEKQLLDYYLKHKETETPIWTRSHTRRYLLEWESMSNESRQTFAGFVREGKLQSQASSGSFVAVEAAGRKPKPENSSQDGEGMPNKRVKFETVHPPKQPDKQQGRVVAIPSRKVKAHNSWPESEGMDTKRMKAGQADAEAEANECRSPKPQSQEVGRTPVRTARPSPSSQAKQPLAKSSQESAKPILRCDDWNASAGDDEQAAEFCNFVDCIRRFDY